MADIKLEDRFPDLKPIDSAPSLGLVNGCGLTIYGSRDQDLETGTFIKTHVLCFLFFPLFALGAYRVGQVGDGRWAFIGREPLSALAKAWNAIVILLLGGAISAGVWHVTYNSPNAVADRALAHAESEIGNGNIVEAARTYRDVMYGDSDRTSKARKALASMHEDQTVTAAELAKIAQVFEIELAVRNQTIGDPIGKSVSEKGMELVEQRGLADLSGASEVIRVITPVVQDSDRFNVCRMPIWKRLVESEPANVQYASQLAAVLAATGSTEECEALLSPHADKLGFTEGARILGQIRADQGKVDEAHSLLLPYCEEHLGDLNVAEANFQSAIESEQRRIIKFLDSGAAPSSFYEKYERATEEQQIQMVEEYLAKKLQDSRKIDEARLAYTKETDVVPVALDLGMVQLRRAQDMQNADERRAELEAAEKTFVSIQSVVGESDEYRLYMGQVNYWLGKYDEGRQLFEQLLDSNQRDFSILVGVANMVREVGRTAEAKKLVEEAYEKTPDATKKHQAAAMRASMIEDNDDRILWLQRSDTNKPSIRAALKSAKGTQAFIDGDFKVAEELYRASVEAYDQTPEDVTQLNNSGLTCFSLYRVSGKQEDFDEGLRRIQKAISLKPADSILRYNAAEILLSSAYGDIVGDKVDANILKSGPSRRTLAFLYSDNETRAPYVDQLQKHNATRQATDMLENVTLLAPKNPSAYESLAEYYGITHDLDALKKLRQSVLKADPDVDLTDLKEFFAGKNDEKFLVPVRQAIDRGERALKDCEANSLTQAVAISELIGFLTHIDGIEPVESWDRMVKLTEQAHKAHPTAGTRSAHVRALLSRAHTSFLKSNSDYQDHAARCRRVLSGISTLTTFISLNEANSRLAHANPDISEAAKICRIDFAAFPESPSSWYWALFRFHDPAYAAKIADAMKQSEHSWVLSDIECLLSPGSMEHAVDAYFRHASSGDLAAATKVLNDVAKHGIPLPFDLK